MPRKAQKGAVHELKAQAVSQSPHFIDPNPQPRVAQPSNEGESLQISSICLSRTCSLLSGVVRLVSSESGLVPSWRVVLFCQGQGSVLSRGWESVEELPSDVESHLSGERLSHLRGGTDQSKCPSEGMITLLPSVSAQRALKPTRGRAWGSQSYVGRSSELVPCLEVS